MAQPCDLVLACLAVDPLLPCALARALCDRGIPAVRLEEEDGRYAEFGRPHELSGDCLTLAVRDGQRLATLQGRTRLLILGDAEDQGLEAAYLLCKRLLARCRPALLGYAPTGCRSRERARRGYYRLASAVHRFLGTALVSFGYLPPWGDLPTAAWQDRLDGLAGLISDDWHQHTAIHHDTGRK